MSFKKRYTLSCREEEVDPIPVVLSSAKQCRKSLELSGSVLVPKACNALAAALQHCSPFVHIDMADCLIGDDGELILYGNRKHGLCEQSRCWCMVDVFIK